MPLLDQLFGATGDDLFPAPAPGATAAPESNPRLARRGRWLLILLIAYITAASTYQAWHRPFWYDEIFTVVIARLDSMSAVWQALDRATDTSPPGYYVVQRLLSAAVGNERIAARLCSIVCVPLVSVCLFAFVRPRTNSVCALIAAIVPLMTTLYTTYAIEARPYAAVTLCLAFALVAWQRVDRAPWSVALAVALAAATSLHYYAVLALGPFVLAETTRTAWLRRWRPRVWVAIAVGTVPFIAFWPLLQKLRSYYGPNYWARASTFRAISSYDEYLSFQSVGTAMGLVLALTLVLLLWVAAAFRGRPGGDPAAPATGVPLSERMMALGFLWLPWVSLIAARAGGGGVTSRYTIAAILGLALSSAYIAHWLGRRATGWVLLVLLTTFSGRELLYWAAELHGRNQSSIDVASVERLLDASGEPNAPVVVSNGLEYVPLVYYSPPRLASRLVSLLDPAAARQYFGTDSIELDLTALQVYMPLQARDYQEFVASHDRFLLYVTPGFGDWWPAHLRSRGFRMEVVAAQPGRMLYRVTR